ncbi:hypothetical protein B0T16DRAFT_406768 [Cercophora newfieldiana]|uniref:DUF7730 domain-containing protein n=1 Tax=Cercophora newfieldiana TaxID=92897 RepID=A0AA40CW20_9PEZI|nr:hypothetical protein B0T16DRAFT_406768 [Cercophora newfieldiana]
MGIIGKWMRKRLDSKPPDKGGLVNEPRSPPLPFLPTPRLRRLTAGQWQSKDSVQLEMESYGLFGKLPLELRREILTEAFGGQTLHMDLSHKHPLVRLQPSEEESQSPPHQHRHCGLESELVCDTSQAKRWEWFSCVCHRRPGYSEAEKEQRLQAMKGALTVEPCDDECLEGSESMCACPSGASTAACFVGVMGWLLSCRQAYTDGVDVLYGTNTFHLSSLELQLNLPRLVPAHHLARITSLQLLWKLNEVQPRSKNKQQPPRKDHARALWEGEGPDNNNPLHLLCGSIPQTFPNLQSLYISFQCWLNPPSTANKGVNDDVISEVESIFLGPVEDMMRACGSNNHNGKLELSVAIQSGAWSTLLAKYEQVLGAGLKAELYEDGRGRFWKPLLPSQGFQGVHDRSGGGVDDGEENRLGYWICSGWDDIQAIGQGYWIMCNWGQTWRTGFGTAM